jgi:uncharacterized Zn finger protein
MLWVIDRALEDESSLMASANKLLKRRTYSETHWRVVADTLENRLQSMKKPQTTSFSDRYRRERLLNHLLDAYGCAGWKDRIIPRLEAEADACTCYTQLVDALLAAGERERARHWCIEGYTRTAGGTPGIAGALQERLRTMAEKERRHDLVAAYRALDFFSDPSNRSYTDLQKAAVSILRLARALPPTARRAKYAVGPCPPPRSSSHQTNGEAVINGFPI